MIGNKLRVARTFRREQGYTLLEVIIALTLLSILALVLSGSLSFGSRVWEHTGRSVRASGDLVSAYQFLDSSFAHLAKPSQGDTTETGNDELVGDSNSVSFHTNGLAEVGLSGPRLLKLGVKDGSLRVWILDPGAQGATTSDEEFVLLHSVASLSLSYLEYGPDRKATGWVSEWPKDAPPPTLLKWSFVRPDEGERTWFFRLPQGAQ